MEIIQPTGSFKKLADKIEKELGIKAANFKRLYPGYWQRAGGAFTWTAMRLTDDGSAFSGFDISSGEPVKQLLAAPGLDISKSLDEIFSKK